MCVEFLHLERCLFCPVMICVALLSCSCREFHHRPEKKSLCHKSKGWWSTNHVRDANCNHTRVAVNERHLIMNMKRLWAAQPAHTPKSVWKYLKWLKDRLWQMRHIQLLYAWAQLRLWRRESRKTSTRSADADTKGEEGNLHQNCAA